MKIVSVSGLTQRIQNSLFPKHFVRGAKAKLQCVPDATVITNAIDENAYFPQTSHRGDPGSASCMMTPSA
jgi:hypothetical protein